LGIDLGQSSPLRDRAGPIAPPRRLGIRRPDQGHTAPDTSLHRKVRVRVQLRRQRDKAPAGLIGPLFSIINGLTCAIRNTDFSGPELKAMPALKLHKAKTALESRFDHLESFEIAGTMIAGKFIMGHEVSS
jgi:hypothetical protein